MDEVGLTMRRPGDRAAKPLLWTDVAAVAYVRVRGRSNQIEVRRTNGALFVIADYQVGSIHRVARAIDRFYPAGGGGGTPRFVPVSGMAYLGR